MSDAVVFVHSKIQYPSYVDYRRLVQISGFESCTFDRMDSKRKCTYVVCPIWSNDVSAAVTALAKGPRACRVIWWYLERPGFFGKRPYSEMADIMLSRGLDEVWISDRAFHALLPRDPRLKFVPVGSDEALGDRTPSAKSYDLCHMSLIHGRREVLLKSLRYHIAPNGYGDARHRALLASRFMLNVHQDDDPFLEPLRFALSAAYGLPILSESCTDPFPFVEGEDFAGAPYGGIQALVAKAISDPAAYRAMGERMFRKAAHEYRFRDNVKRALTS